MPITINTQVLTDIAVESEKLLVGAVLLTAVQHVDGTPVVTPTAVRINSVDDLVANFMPAISGAGTEGDPYVLNKKSLYELASLEYLLMNGVNLVVYAKTPTVGTDLNVFDAFEEPGVKFMVVPYATLTNNKVVLGYVEDYIVGRDIQLIVDAGAVTAANVSTAISEFTTSAKVEAIVNSGMPSGYTSQLATKYTALELGVSLAIPSDFDTDYHGVYASHAVVVRKVAWYEQDKPYEPVAGETNAIISEFSELEHGISNAEKNAIQALNVNVLRMKQGVGPLISAQNTLFVLAGSTSRHPFRRSHAVTLTLWLKDKLRRLSESILQRPNNLKTWNLWELKLDDIMEALAADEGILDFSIVTGRTIMTQDDIDDGIMKAKVYFTPARPLESIQINLFVRETVGLVEAAIQGGIL